MFEILSDFLISKLCDTLFQKAVSFIKRNPIYQNYSKTIDIASTHKDFCDIIESAYKKAMSSPLISKVPKKILKQSVLSNNKIITNWLYSPQNVQFSSEDITIPNYDYEKQIISFLNSIHSYILGHRNDYISFSSGQLQSLALGIQNTLDQNKIYLDNQFQAIENHFQILENRGEIKKSWPCNETLQEIEKEFKLRNYQVVITKLDTIKPIIETNNNIEETEKFYELCTNYFLTTDKTQESAIPYFEKLIENTRDPLKLKKRNLSLLFIKKDFSKVIQIADSEMNKILNENDRVFFVDLKFKALYRLGNQESYKAYLETISDIYPDYLLWKVRCFDCDGNYSNAKKIIDSNQEYFENNYERRIAKVETLGYFYADEYSKIGGTIDHFSVVPHIIEECDILLKEAGEDIIIKETILVAKALLARVINDDENCMKSFSELKRINSKHPNFLRIYPLELLRYNAENNKIEALQYMKEFLSYYPDDIKIQVIYFDVLISVDPEEALKELLQITHRKENLIVVIRVVYAYLKNLDYPNAEHYLNNLKNEYPEEYPVLLAEGDLLSRKGKNEEALFVYNKANSLNIDDSSKLVLIQKITRILLTNPSKESVYKTIDLFDSIQNRYELYNLFGHEYIYCFLYLQDWIKAEEKIQESRNLKIITNELIHDEIWCNFTCRNYQKVLTLFDELKTLHFSINENDKKILMWSSFELGEVERLEQSIDYLPPCNTVQEFLYTYQRLRALGLFDKAIEIAHEAYLRFPKEIPILEMFWSSIHTSGKTDIPSDILEDLKICEKYYFSLPENKRNFKLIQIPQNATGKEILKALESALPKQNEFDYVGFINKNHLHISFLVNSGFDYFSLWKASQVIKGFKIYISSGDLNKERQVNSDIQTAKKVIFDLPSLISCAYLNLLEYLPHVFESILITQDTLSEIQKVILSQNDPLSENWGRCIYRINGNKYPETKIDFSNIPQLAKKIKKFIDDNNIIVIGQELIPQKKMPDKLENVLKQANLLEYQTIKYAYESDSSLSLESSLLKDLLLEFPNSPKTFSVENILSLLLKNKIITPQEYVKKTVKLIISNYVCVPINANAILLLLQETGFTITDEITKLFDVFKDETIFNIKWISMELFTLLSIIWNTNLVIQIKEYITLFTVQTLSSRTDFTQELFNIQLDALMRVIREPYKQEFYEFLQKQKDL